MGRRSACFSPAATPWIRAVRWVAVAGRRRSRCSRRRAGSGRGARRSSSAGCTTRTGRRPGACRTARAGIRAPCCAGAGTCSAAGGTGTCGTGTGAHFDTACAGRSTDLNTRAACPGANFDTARTHLDASATAARTPTAGGTSCEDRGTSSDAENAGQ